MHYSEYEDDEGLLVEFRELVSNSCTFVDSWSDSKITPSMYRFYGKHFAAIEATNQFVDGVKQTSLFTTYQKNLKVILRKIDFHILIW